MLLVMPSFVAKTVNTYIKAVIHTFKTYFLLFWMHSQVLMVPWIIITKTNRDFLGLLITNNLFSL